MGAGVGLSSVPGLQLGVGGRPGPWRVGPQQVQVVMVVLASTRLRGGDCQLRSHQLSWGPRGASPRLRCSVLRSSQHTFPSTGEGEKEGGREVVFLFEVHGEGVQWGVAMTRDIGQDHSW